MKNKSIAKYFEYFSNNSLRLIISRLFSFLSPIYSWKIRIFFSYLLRFSARLRQIFSLEIRVACRISGPSSEIESCSLYAFSRTTTRGGRGEARVWKKEKKNNRWRKKWGWKSVGGDWSVSSFTTWLWRPMLDRWIHRWGMSHKIKIKNKTRGEIHIRERCIWKLFFPCSPFISLVNYPPLPPPPVDISAIRRVLVPSFSSLSNPLSMDSLSTVR